MCIALVLLTPRFHEDEAKRRFQFQDPNPNKPAPPCFHEDEAKRRFP
jgi:hypothetical protein